MIEVGSSTRWTRCLQRLSLSTVATKTNGREAMPTFGASARRFLCGWRRGKEEAAVLVALALLAAQQPTIAATRNSGTLPWRSAQATSSPQPAAAHRPQPAAAPPSPQPTPPRGPTATCRRAVAAE